MGVIMEKNFQSIDDPDTQVGQDERVKGFKYGKTLVRKKKRFFHKIFFS
jgi:hypothetical protein